MPAEFTRKEIVDLDTYVDDTPNEAHGSVKDMIVDDHERLSPTGTRYSLVKTLAH